MGRSIIVMKWAVLVWSSLAISFVGGTNFGLDAGLAGAGEVDLAGRPIFGKLMQL
jgi:hypothetical protein